MVILVAEDESNIALAIKTIISRKLDKIEVITVSNGLKAYEVYKNRKLDLIISDWNMPGMSGKDLLACIRGEDDDQLTPFLMLTARADADSVRDAISSGVTDYVAKPFDKSMLLEKVDYLLKSNSSEAEKTASVVVKDGSVMLRVSELIRIRLKKGYVNFPVLPEVAFKAVSIINSDDVSMNDVADIVKVDAALSSKIMALANSVHYRARNTIDSLDEAIARIGLRETMNAVLIYAMKELYRDKNKLYEKYLRDLWEKTLTTAAVARSLGQSKHNAKPEKLYSLGMFYNIGKLLILPILMEMKDNRTDITEYVIQDVMDYLSSEIGGAVMKHWGFGDIYISTVKSRFSHGNNDVVCEETGLVQLAAYATQGLSNKSVASSTEDAHNQCKLLMEVSDEMLSNAMSEALRYVVDVKNSLFS